MNAPPVRPPDAPPPIWQGTARHGDYAEVLSRNPDGTFQVRIRGQEQTRTERDVAYMTGMNKPALDAHLDGATQTHLARGQAPSGPPIWQGTARHGDYAEVLSRNPNGTFQVRIRGQEQTRTERDVAYMTGMNKPALDAHLDEATQTHLARGQAPSGPPIWQGTARHGDYAEVLSRNPNGTFQVRIRGQEQTRTERDVAYMTGMNKPALDAHLDGVTAGMKGNAGQTQDLQEARWSPKVIPKGVSTEAVTEWREHLQSKRVSNPVLASELVHWQDSSVPEGKSLAGEKIIERSIQSMLDLIPREVIERLGKLHLATVQSIPGGVIAHYNPFTNTIEINQAEYSTWKDIDTKQVQKGIVAQSMLAPYIRETMWHEMGHWLHAHASSHPRLWKWRRNLEQHWRERTEGERVLTHKDGWKYVRDRWLTPYVGRWYPGLGWGLELPTVYLEEISHGPERVAQWCQKPHHVLTFKIVSSLFGPL